MSDEQQIDAILGKINAEHGVNFQRIEVKPTMRERKLREGWEEIAHATSIAQIPSEQLPDGACRVDLITRALNGEEIYAYTPFGSDQYILWIDDGSGKNDCRWNPAQYAEAWERENDHA